MGDQKEAVEKTIVMLFDKMSMRSTDWWCEGLREIVDRDQFIKRICIEFEENSVTLDR